MHKCIRYLDHSLRRFFERVSTEPWYERTLFVIAGDHTNLTDQAFYQTSDTLARLSSSSTPQARSSLHSVVMPSPSKST